MFILEKSKPIAADCALLSCQEFSANESLLTGESVPLNEQVSTSETPSDMKPAPSRSRRPLAYFGSLSNVFAAFTGLHFIADMLANLFLAASERAKQADMELARTTTF